MNLYATYKANQNKRIEWRKGITKKGVLLRNKYLHCVVLPRCCLSRAIGCSFMNVAQMLVYAQHMILFPFVNEYVLTCTTGQHIERGGLGLDTHTHTHTKQTPPSPHAEHLLLRISSAQWDFVRHAHHVGHIDQLRLVLCGSRGLRVSSPDWILLIHNTIVGCWVEARTNKAAPHINHY